MRKAGISREQLGFASNNLSANSNAYFRIFIFLSPGHDFCIILQYCVTK